MTAFKTGDDEAAELRRRLTDPRALALALDLARGMSRGGGNGVLVLCPAHKERTPSCSIARRDDGTLSVHCFGCGFSGNVFHLIAAARGLDARSDFPRVIEEARRLAGVTAPAAPERRERMELRIVGPTAQERAFGVEGDGLLGLLPLTGAWAQDVACSLAARGLVEQARADGWAALPPPGGCLQSPPAWLRPSHRLLIPWRGPGGRLWTLQQRWCRADGDTQASPPEGSKYLFPPGRVLQPTQGYPYGWDRAEGGEAAELWICEGAVDVLAIRALNARGLLTVDGTERRMAVVGLPGLAGWKFVAAPVLGLARCRTVILALDSDAAADAAVDGLRVDLYGAGASRVKRVRSAVGKDWADWTRTLWLGRPS